MEPRGLYRERNGWGNQHSARVKYDEHQELDLPEDRYRERGYQRPSMNCLGEMKPLTMPNYKRPLGASAMVIHIGYRKMNGR